ncbi:MAG: hypothetical protein MJZ11_14375 [Lachnospiraceae bacterium]|nr:hypothetical protein [Lachnospiraceae bacterium]
MDVVIKFLDEEWHNQHLYTFYQLEDKFGYPDARVLLIVTLRYCYLDYRFNDDLLLYNRVGLTVTNSLLKIKI